MIAEIEKFISDYGDGNFPTITKYYDNYHKQIQQLIDKDQIIVLRNREGFINGVCGWIRVNREDEWKINKVTWSLPENISDGNNLYICFCVLKGGNIYGIRRHLTKNRELCKKIDEVFWFNVPTNRFIRMKNILKERSDE